MTLLLHHLTQILSPRAQRICAPRHPFRVRRVVSLATCIPSQSPTCYLSSNFPLIFHTIFLQGHKRTPAHVPSMRPLYHTSHRPSFVLVIPRPILPHNLPARIAARSCDRCPKPFEKTDSLLCPAQKSTRVSLAFVTEHARMALHELVRVPCGSSLRTDSGASSGLVLVFTVVAAIVRNGPSTSLTPATG
jgi:hypothetical protein